MKNSSPILVTGATGTQGGAVARLLRERGHAVRAMTRKPDSPAARALAQQGVEVVAGDFDDAASTEAALRGADAVFAMGTPYGSTPETEIRQATALADAAKRAGAFLVYSSVGSADRGTGIPHFDSKYEVEKHIRARDIEATVLAPAFFMENLYSARAALKQGFYPSPLSPARRLQQVAAADIAAVAVSVLEDRARYAGKRYDLAGDELTGEDVVRILSAVTGRPVRYEQVPLEAIRAAMGEDGARMFAWFERVGYSADRAALAREFPDVRWTSFEAWARGVDWKEFLAP